jgi:hypothetical protein
MITWVWDKTLPRVQVDLAVVGFLDSGSIEENRGKAS